MAWPCLQRRAPGRERLHGSAAFSAARTGGRSRWASEARSGRRRPQATCHAHGVSHPSAHGGRTCSVTSTRSVGSTRHEGGPRLNTPFGAPVVRRRRRGSGATGRTHRAAGRRDAARVALVDGDDLDDVERAELHAAILAAEQELDAGQVMSEENIAGALRRSCSWFPRVRVGFLRRAAPPASSRVLRAAWP